MRISLRDSHARLLCRHLPDPPPACYLCAPMIAHGETFGLLHLRLNQHQQAPSGEALPEPVEFPWPAKSIAEQLALAVSNMNLREVLLAQSIRDPLTGWFNRRYMEETLEREIARAARSRQPLAVIMLDVDKFKEFNDSFGHEAGDVALQNLCQTLKSHFEMKTSPAVMEEMSSCWSSQTLPRSSLCSEPRNCGVPWHAWTGNTKATCRRR